MNLHVFYQMKVGDWAREILTKAEGYVIENREHTCQLQMEDGSKRAFYPYEIELVKREKYEPE